MSMQGLTAQRFAGKPLRQPKYSMKDVPRTSKDLSNSTLYEISNRDHFNDSMAEFVLLCNEVMRRKSVQAKNKRSKPLSLEYMADRLDVDDPIFGFMVRTHVMPEDYPVDQREYFLEGMLQGFITVTTFTNWQKSFRWDTMHDSAFAYDDPELAAAIASKVRIHDYDGSLAAQLQNTVRCGDPWNEGIVWPKIAEISLLGALGCGKALLSLVLERLEAMQANGKHNYDYVVLQATDNSIPFYESMGFVRVGCVTEQILSGESDDDDADADADDDDNNGNANDKAKVRANAKKEIETEEEKSEIVSSPVISIKTTEYGETASDYAKKYGVDVWDIIFLSHFMYPELTPNAALMAGTQLYIPDTSKLDGCTNASTNISASKAVANGATQWYFSEDNETPREIAKKFSITCKGLLAANRGRLEDLKQHSRLMEGTRLQVSNLDQPMDESVPYCHWTFPDDKFENNPDPSYMMALKLNRKSKFEAKVKPVEESFAAKVQVEYDSASVPTSVVQAPGVPSPELKTPKKSSKKRKRHPEEPIAPKRPSTAYLLFLHGEKEILIANQVKISMPELAKATSQRFKALPEEMKAPFIQQAKELRPKYEEEMEQYKVEMEKFKATHPDWISQQQSDDIDAPSTKKGKTKLGYKNLFNTVVKLNKEGQREAGSEFQYYYVLTYLPDLFWCHLAPMVPVGIFGPNRRNVEGRTKWMLVDEGEGRELDITGAVCEPIKSRSMRGCADADKEEWDIIDPNGTIIDKATYPTSHLVHIGEEVTKKEVQKRRKNASTPASKVRSTKPKPTPTPKSATKVKKVKEGQLKSKSFDQRLEDLKLFQIKYGHCEVPYTFKPNQSLSNWCSNVRYSYGLSLRGLTPTIKMTSERIKVLKAVGFVFKHGDDPAGGKKKEVVVDEHQDAYESSIEATSNNAVDGEDASAASIDKEVVEDIKDKPCESEESGAGRRRSSRSSSRRNGQDAPSTPGKQISESDSSDTASETQSTRSGARSLKENTEPKPANVEANEKVITPIAERTVVACSIVKKAVQMSLTSFFKR